MMWQERFIRTKQQIKKILVITSTKYYYFEYDVKSVLKTLTRTWEANELKWKKHINIKIFNIYMDFKLLKISLKFWIIKFLFTQQKIYRRHIHMHWAQSSSNKCSKSITKHLDIQNNIRPNSILPHNLFISACVLFIVCICYSVKIGSPVVRSQRISLDFRKVRKILCI